MKRNFSLENGREIKLDVQGFDAVPVLVGTETSAGESSLKNLNRFNNCRIATKYTNIKDAKHGVVQLKTFYTVAKPKNPLYNNPIIENTEKNKTDMQTIEVCLGTLHYKRFVKLEYLSTLSLVEITDRICADILEALNGTKKDFESEPVENNISIALYDEDGFEFMFDLNPSNIASYILSVRIINSDKSTSAEKINSKAKRIFEILKSDFTKKKVDIIANISQPLAKTIFKTEE